MRKSRDDVFTHDMFRYFCYNVSSLFKSVKFNSNPTIYPVEQRPIFSRPIRYRPLIRVSAHKVARAAFDLTRKW